MKVESFKTVSVIGAGSWGTAIANVLADHGAQTTLYGRDRSVCNSIERTHENTKYLPGHRLSEAITPTSDLRQAVTHSALLVNAIPVQEIRSVYRDLGQLVGSTPILNISKGIETGTCLRVSEMFEQLLPDSPYAVLSGPSFAKEVVARLPTAVTVASSDRQLCNNIQVTLHTPYFRTYTSSDVIGVELAGAIKNVIAIGSGLADGLNLGLNAQAALVNRGLAEIMRLSVKLGAVKTTFLGLAGIGDLMLTCTGPLSRNRQLGTLIAKGLTLGEARARLGGVAEGEFTTKAVVELARLHAVDVPISTQVLLILTGQIDAKQALANLMSRELKEEAPSFG